MEREPMRPVSRVEQLEEEALALRGIATSNGLKIILAKLRAVANEEGKTSISLDDPNWLIKTAEAQGRRNSARDTLSWIEGRLNSDVALQRLAARGVKHGG